MTRPTGPQRRAQLLIATIATGAVVMLGGCAPGGTGDGATNVPGPSSSAAVNNSIDPANIAAISTAIRSRGLAISGQRDATSELCGSAGCTKAYAFDQLSILKFPTTGRAELYNGSVDDAYQVLDLVVTFPADGAGSENRERYEEAIRQAVQ